MKSDTIWTGGDILTMDPSRPSAQAMAASAGRIIAVGSDAEIEALAGPGTRRVALHGRFVMPGLVESHTHALWGGCRELFDVYVGYAASLGDLIAATKARAGQTEPGGVVYGGPWRHDMRPEMGSVPRLALDAISDAHPIILLDATQHVLWCNSRALADAGIGPDTPDIPGGVIERDETGAPTGILAETAGLAVRRLMTRTDDQLRAAVRHFVDLFLRLGFTAFKEPMAFEPELRIYQAADLAGDLKLHAAAHISRNSLVGGAPTPYDEIDRMRAQYASENLRTGFAKLFLDGVAPSYTASFIDPYLAESGYDAASHDPNATLLIDPKELNDTVSELDRRGYVVKMHAVGDNAIRKGLDAIEAARNANGASGLRHEIAHSAFVSDADLSRFRSLDAIAELSPKLWFPNPSTPAQRRVLGEERLSKCHRLRDLLDAGAEATYASDWPAAAPDPNPWTGLSGMLTRRNTDPAYPGVLGDGQQVSLQEALPLFTTNGARSLGMEGETGALTPGAWADFIVLDRNLRTIAPEAAAGVEVLETVWKGETAWCA